MSVTWDETNRRWVCRYMIAGKAVKKVCKGCNGRKEAEAFEKKLREAERAAYTEKTVDQFRETVMKDRYGVDVIPLSEAFSKAMAKPGQKDGQKNRSAKKEVWDDFATFMADKYPSATDISMVQKKHAQAYIAAIETDGRYNKAVTYIRNGKEITRLARAGLSSRTQIFYHTTLKGVFSALAQDVGMQENPFDFKKTKLEAETREPFTPTEIQMILKHGEEDTFVLPLFKIALATGLREGDICMLQWDNIDLINNIMRVKMRKTGKTVEIPCGHIREYLLSLRCDPTYVLPEHAKMYQSNPAGISDRIKQFLEGIGITTTRQVTGRAQAVSIKDLHSCRHTFVYLATKAGFPMPVIQSIVGHTTIQMTEHYAAHSTLEDKRILMNALLTGAADPTAEQRKQAHSLIDCLTPEQLAAFLQEYGK